VALEKVFDGVLAARRFVQANPRERLLLLLHKDFGDRADLDRSEFYAWATRPSLIEPIDDLIAGRRQPDEETRALLADEIEPCLYRVQESDRADLAGEIAQALVRGYPLALKEFAEFGQLLANKIDMQAATSHEEHSEMLGILRRLDQGNADSELARMLLVGSLEQVGQAANSRRAEEMAASGQFPAAAAVYLEIADAFAVSGTGTLAESYRLRAAAMYERAGRTEDAAELLEQVARDRIARRAQESVFTTRELERLLGKTPLVRAMEACANWPELGYATDWLREGIADEDQTERRLRFQAALAEIESMIGDPETILADAQELQGELSAGPRLAIELDRIAARESESPDKADTAWAALEEWAETVADPASRGRCWSRRGLQLANRGDLAGARSAYRRSMAAWAEEPGSQEQVAEAFFSLQAAELLLGEWAAIDFDLRPVAASLRGAPGTPAAIARRLQHAAADARIRQSFPDAHRDNWLALAEHRSYGSLQGILEVGAQLAELYVATGRAPAAISLFVSAGKGKEAAQLVRGLSPTSVAAALSTGGAPWQRAAAYQVLVASGANAPDELVALFAEQLLADSDPTRRDFPESLRLAAAHAVASVTLQMPDHLKPVAFERLEVSVLDMRALDLGRASARSLIRLTQIGEYDAAERLVELFLGDRPQQDIDPSWVGDLIAENDALRTQVLAAARDGNEQALEALAWANYEDDADDALRAAATEQVTLFAKAVSREESVDGTPRTVAHHMGIRFPLGGLLARLADSDANAALAAHLRTIAFDEADAESSRASALDGLFNMAAQLDGSVRAELVDEIRPLAFGEYERSDVERSEVDPLRRFQLRHDVVDLLQASAIGLAARFVALDTEVGYLQDAVDQALVHPTPRVRAAALDALARVPSLVPPAELASLLRDSDDQVARQAVKAMAAHQAEWFDENLQELTTHPSYSVRMLVLMVAREKGQAEVLRAMAERDPNSYLRGLARRDLRELEGDGA
jgi:hypothetical protein